MIKIDSFKLRIPKSEIKELIDCTNLERGIVMMVLSTGEVISEQTLKVQKLSNDGGITSIAIGIETIPIKRIPTEYLTLKVTSKLLKQSYYDGINIDNLKQIVEYLHSVGIPISIEKLLSAEITDIDFCKDFTISEAKYPELIDSINSNAKSFKQSKRGLNIFNQKDNKGIEFSSRKTATPANPFFKIYNKFLDSQSVKHSVFFSYYKLETNPDLHRLEFTLKNKRHFDKYQLSNKLIDFLTLDQTTLKNILSDITDHHLNKPKDTNAIMELRKNQNVIESYIEWGLELSTRLNIPYETSKDLILNTIEKKMTRYRHSKMFDKVHYELKNSSAEYANKTYINSLMIELCLA
jgi:hypothetical protein